MKTSSDTELRTMVNILSKFGFSGWRIFWKLIDGFYQEQWDTFMKAQADGGRSPGRIAWSWILAWDSGNAWASPWSATNSWMKKILEHSLTPNKIMTPGHSKEAVCYLKGPTVLASLLQTPSPNAFGKRDSRIGQEGQDVSLCLCWLPSRMPSQHRHQPPCRGSSGHGAWAGLPSRDAAPWLADNGCSCRDGPCAPVHKHLAEFLSCSHGLTECQVVATLRRLI